MINNYKPAENKKKIFNTNLSNISISIINAKNND